MTPIEVRLDRRISDYTEAFASVMKPRLTRLSLLVLALLLLFESLHGNMDMIAGRVHVVEAILLDIAIAAAVWVVGYWSTVTRAAQRMYRMHLKNTGAKYLLDEGGLEYSSSAGTSYTKWDAFNRLRETPSLFLLFQPNRRFQLLPKRGIENARLDEARVLLRQKLVSRR